MKKKMFIDVSSQTILLERFGRAAHVVASKNLLNIRINRGAAGMLRALMTTFIYQLDISYIENFLKSSPESVPIFLKKMGTFPAVL